MPDVFDKALRWPDLKQAEALGTYPFYRPIEDRLDGTEVVIAGRTVLMAGSNDYLGLACDPRVKEAAARALSMYGTTCSGSRLLNGTLHLHNELEERLAAHFGRPACALASTGYQTNLAVISALVGRHDVLVFDRQNHASLLDGARLSFGELRRFAHNDLDALDRTLAQIPPTRGRLVVVDGVYSMEGDLCALPGVARLARQHGARLLLDDAHGVGVLGAHGRGTAELLGVESEVDLLVGTFSKAFGSVGGFVLGPREVVDFIKHRARPVVFSASMAPAHVAAASAALTIMQEEPERRARVRALGERVVRELTSLGFDTLSACTPIVPIKIGDAQRCFRFGTELLEEGVYANVVIPPAVAPGDALVRTSFMASHRDDQIDRILATLEKVGRRLGVLPASRAAVRA